MSSKNTQFDDLWGIVFEKCLDLYDIKPANNAKFVSEIIFERFRDREEFQYVECGVYQGTTFLPVYHVCQLLFKQFKMWGVDSFSGFPLDVTLNKEDKFESFEKLFKEGKISSSHLDCARERCSRIDDNSHLSTGYFSDYEKMFRERCEGKTEIKVIKTVFSLLQNAFSKERNVYDLTFLDCDLYMSYRQCLKYFNDKTEIFIFDEYYSHKYPGARIAVDEFLEEDTRWYLFNKNEVCPYFERWGMSRKHQ